MLQPSPWPDGKRFAFTIFDDTDRTTSVNGREIYALLRDLGMRTTKSVWPISGEGTPRVGGATLEDPTYLKWVLELEREGFEIALHGAAPVSSPRAQTIRGLDRFAEIFGADPRIHVNHASNQDSIYWGASRLSGNNRLLYQFLTRSRMVGLDGGSTPSSPYFWGDVARERVEYVRNFVFRDMNTLRQCPEMPYHDPQRPFVNRWFASSEGATLSSFCHTIREEQQDRLEADGGACIMYTHFGVRAFRPEGRLHPRFVALMTRLADKGGWFVPVHEVLDRLRMHQIDPVLSAASRDRLERTWLFEKVFVTRGTS